MVSLDWVLFGLRIFATIILYTFLGLAFYVIWRDLRQAEAEQAGGLSQTQQCLRVVAAPDDQSLKVGDMAPLYPVTFLGRDPDNTVVLNDVSVSSRHACISRRDGVWWLEDLGSLNGTRLNDLPLSKPAPLTNDDLIEIGDLRFRLESSL